MSPAESALNAPAEMVHYGMTKAAQLSVARGLAQTTAGSGVTVNSVLSEAGNPLRRVGTFAELAAARVSLAEAEQAFFAHARPTSLLKRF